MKSLVLQLSRGGGDRPIRLYGSVTELHSFLYCVILTTTFINFITLTRDIDIAIMSVCSSVRPSVAFQYSMKTA